MTDPRNDPVNDADTSVQKPVGETGIKPAGAAVPFNSPGIWLATWFGCGLIRPAPGTWGSIGALPFGILMMIYGGWPVLLAASILISLIGLWAAAQYEAKSGVHDSSSIVIDEVAGMWINLLPAALNPVSIVLALILFRLFDIAKPGPVGWADKKLPGAQGVMADDIIAGIIGAIILFGLRHYAHIG